MTQAVVLFGHGSRDPLWCRPIQAVADRLAVQQPDLLVACAWLELQPPDLPAAVGHLASVGATDIAVLPMFLGMGRHAREDLPRLVDELRLTHPTIRFTLRPAVGEHPELLQALVKIATS